MPSAQKPIALPRSCGSNDSSSTACDSGCSAPPVAPCRMRKKISDARFGAIPHRKDEIVNPVTESIRRRLRPNVAASQPVIGRMIALATRYDVSTQVASSIVADIDAAMCGSDTLTTVVSSTSMKVPNITAIATIQGLTLPCSVIDYQPPTTNLFCIHLRGHRHAWPQYLLRVLLLVNGNAD